MVTEELLFLLLLLAWDTVYIHPLSNQGVGIDPLIRWAVSVIGGMGTGVVYFITGVIGTGDSVAAILSRVGTLAGNAVVISTEQAVIRAGGTIGLISGITGIEPLGIGH